MHNRENNVSRGGNIRKQVSKLGNIVSATKNVFEFVGKHFCFLGSKFCFRNNVSPGGKQGNIDKHNVSATLFPNLPRT